MRVVHVLSSIYACAIVGCGLAADEAATARPADDLAVYVHARVAPAQRAFARPTGIVDAASMPAVVRTLREQTKDASSTEMPLVQGKTTPQALAVLGGSGAACTRYEPGVTVVDLGCSTSGLTTGTLRIRTAGTSAATFAVVEIEGACTEATCTSGEMLVETDGPATSPGASTIVRDLRITREGVTNDEISAIRVDGERRERLMWRGADSFVVSGGADSAVVAGGNGRFECRWSDAGEHGSCSTAGSPADVRFAW